MIHRMRGPLAEAYAQDRGYTGRYPSVAGCQDRLDASAEWRDMVVCIREYDYLHPTESATDGAIETRDTCCRNDDAVRRARCMGTSDVRGAILAAMATIIYYLGFIVFRVS